MGRLDADSEGLVLLTDDGKCADALLQPKSKVAKTYVVEFARDVDDGDVTRLADGVEIETPCSGPARRPPKKRGRARCPARATGGCDLYYQRAATASCGAWPRPGHAVVRLDAMCAAEVVAHVDVYFGSAERGAARADGVGAGRRRRARRRGGFFVDLVDGGRGDGVGAAWPRR